MNPPLDVSSRLRPPLLPNERNVMLELLIRLHALSRSRMTGEAGQATAEYALVVLGAAAIAALVLAWAAGTGKINSLLNAVIDSVIGRVS